MDAESMIAHKSGVKLGCKPAPLGPHIPNEFFDSNYFNSVKNDIINFIVFTGRTSDNLLAERMVNKVHLSGGVYTLRMQFEVPVVNSYFRYKDGPI